MQLIRPRTYLLSLLVLAFACNGGAGTSDTDTDASATDATDASGSSSDSTAGSTDGSATEATTMGPGGSGTEDGSTGDATDTEATTDPGTTGPGDDDLCAALCELEASCDQADPACLEECQLSLEIYGGLGSCLEPYEAVFECAIQLTCEEYEAFYNEQGDDYPCKAEKDAFVGDEDPYPPCAADDPPEVCLSSCELLDSCDVNEGTVEECVAFCAVTIGTSVSMGESCQAAYEELYGCYAELECADLEGPEPCEAESLAVETDCDF